MAGEARAHPSRDVLDQRRVGDDQAFARALVSGRLIPPPQLLELDRFDVGFHVSPAVFSLGPGVSAGVCGSQAARLYPSVDLGGRNAGVAEQLLNSAQVGSALQQ